MYLSQLNLMHGPGSSYKELRNVELRNLNRFVTAFLPDLAVATS